MPVSRSGPVTPGDLADLARRRYRRDSAGWAAGSHGQTTQGIDAQGDVPAIDVPLHPPTQAQVLADLEAAITWVESWRSVGSPVEVTWEDRRWASAGHQRVPVRARIHGAASIAAVARQGAAWRDLDSRLGGLRRHWVSSGTSDSTGTSGEAPDPLAAALRRNSAAIVALEATELERLIAVVDWLIANPDSRRYVRSLPVRGVDTKWLGAHRTLVERLHTALTGRTDLGLRQSPDLVRMRIMGERWHLGGMGDLAAPLSELAAIDWTRTDAGTAPRAVLVLENLESLVALPALPIPGGAVAVHGGGFAVGRLAQVPWLREAEITYWGDLDSHGFRALELAREALPRVTSVLMDRATLAAHRELCVSEPVPHTAEIALLTREEAETLRELRAGDLRLEQERVEWEYAVRELTLVLSR